MRYWIISDSHFGHDNICDFENRPKDFNERIIKNWNEVIKENDYVIHLGDIHLGSTNTFNDYISQLNGKIIMTRGNHDKKSYQWYQNNGIHFVCEWFTLKAYGLDLIFSHECIPIIGGGWINIHGHSHSKIPLYDDENHVLVNIEETGTKLKPILLRTLLHERKLI